MAKTKKEVAPPAENPLAGKPKAKKYLSQEKDAVPKKLTTLEMIVQAVASNSEHKGATLQFVKKYITDNYGEATTNSLKKAFVKGIQDEVIIRPKAAEGSTGMTGRFKVNKDRVKNGKIMKPNKTKKKVQPASDDESTPKPKNDTAATKGKKGKTAEVSEEGSKAPKSKKGDAKSKKAVAEETKETKKGTKSKTTKKETKNTKNEEQISKKATKEKPETKTKSKAKDKPEAKAAPKGTAKEKKTAKKVTIMDDVEKTKPKAKGKKGGGKNKANDQSDSEVYEDDIEDRQHAKETAELKLSPKLKKNSAKGKKKAAEPEPQEEVEDEEDAAEEADAEDESAEEEEEDGAEEGEEEDTASDNEYEDAKATKRTHVVLKGKKIEANEDGSLKLDLSGSSKDEEESEEEPAVPVKRTRKGR